VRLVKQKQTGKFYAAKILKKIEILKSKQIDHVQNESQILNMLHHPFVVHPPTFRFSSRASRKMPVTSTS
jgi:protein kinase A